MGEGLPRVGLRKAQIIGAVEMMAMKNIPVSPSKKVNSMSDNKTAKIVANTVK